MLFVVASHWLGVRNEIQSAFFTPSAAGYGFPSTESVYGQIIPPLRQLPFFCPVYSRHIHMHRFHTAGLLETGPWDWQFHVHIYKYFRDFYRESATGLSGCLWRFVCFSTLVLWVFWGGTGQAALFDTRLRIHKTAETYFPYPFLLLFFPFWILLIPTELCSIQVGIYTTGQVIGGGAISFQETTGRGGSIIPTQREGQAILWSLKYGGRQKTGVVWTILNVSWGEKRVEHRVVSRFGGEKGEEEGGKKVERIRDQNKRLN